MTVTFHVLLRSSRFPGVSSSEVSLSLERATVTYDPALATPEQVRFVESKPLRISVLQNEFAKNSKFDTSDPQKPLFKKTDEIYVEK